MRAWALVAAFVLAGCASTAPSAKSVATAFRDCADCPQMLRLPGGSFTMGDLSGGGNADENPVHSVTLGAFAIGRYKLTRGEYAAFMKDSGRVTVGDCFIVNASGASEKQASATWQSPTFSQTDRDPAVCVTWEDAMAYTAWLSRKTGRHYRLLSEAEWEFAARAGTTGKFWWGEDGDGHCAFDNGGDQTMKRVYPNASTSACDDGYVYTAPVGSYRLNGFGLYDITGNAWEWVEDCYHDTYVGAPSDGSAWIGTDCRSRVLRSGSWRTNPDNRRSAHRGKGSAQYRGNAYGVRIARDR